MYNALHTHLYHVNTGDIGAFAGMPLETLNMAGCGYDDLVDSTTQAIMRFRQGGLITHPEDYQDEELPKRKYKYYW